MQPGITLPALPSDGKTNVFLLHPRLNHWAVGYSSPSDSLTVHILDSFLPGGRNAQQVKYRDTFLDETGRRVIYDLFRNCHQQPGHRLVKVLEMAVPRQPVPPSGTGCCGQFCIGMLAGLGSGLSPTEMETISFDASRMGPWIVKSIDDRKFTWSSAPILRIAADQVSANRTRWRRK